MLTRSATRWILPALLLAGPAWTNAPAEERVDGYRTEIGVEGGFFVPDEDVSGKDSDIQEMEPLGGLRFGVRFARFFDWIIDADFADVNTNSSVPPPAPGPAARPRRRLRLLRSSASRKPRRLSTRLPCVARCSSA